MLEVLAHHQLKQLIQQGKYSWPHNLTLSRLVARNIRRKDNSLIQIEIGKKDTWWIGLLIPLSLQSQDVVLVLSKRQRERLINFELPKLKKEGVYISCWEGLIPPPGSQLWLIDHSDLYELFRQGKLRAKQIIYLEADLLTDELRDAMEISINSKDWERLIRANQSAEVSLIQIYERLSRRINSQIGSFDRNVKIDWGDVIPLRDFLQILDFSDEPWSALLKIEQDYWASWAVLDKNNLTWDWKLQPLDPLIHLKQLFYDNSNLFLAHSQENSLFISDLKSISLSLDVDVKLGGPIVQEPISLFVPNLQPLPNTPYYPQHLLDHCRRLILGQFGLTIILLDDEQLRLSLTSSLASEFGTRVKHQSVTTESNCVVVSEWSWWLNNQDNFSIPTQVIVGLLPLASLSYPLVAARLDRLKKQRRDWFRELLLPEALRLIPRALAPLREKGGRVAVLDGRIRARSWGSKIFKTLEPWIPLNRLLPS